MKPRLQISKAAIGLIKPFEGYRRVAARLADGRWTIGYGHTLTARQGAQVSESDAEALLLYDLLAIGAAVNDWTFTPLTQNQFDALASFAFNVGLDAFAASNVLRLVNEGAMLQAAQAIEAWRKADFHGDEIVVDALIRRRAAEKALFLTPEHGFVPAPSAIVKPRLDHDAVFARTIVLDAPMDGERAVAIPVVIEEAPLTVEAPAELPAPAEPEPVASPPAEPLRRPPPEVLYEIPGYGVERQPHPIEARLTDLPLYQLLLIGAGGLALLLLSFVLAMHGAAATGTAKTAQYGLAALAGLAGAVGVFWAIYQSLNRLDRES